VTSEQARSVVITGPNWGALLAMWQLIGEDFVIDFLWWQATGESLRGVAHSGDRSARDQARAWFENAGTDFTGVP
jgi:hypothetical protein